jgi:hypothetical protein
MQPARRARAVLALRHAQDLGRRLVADFAANLNACLSSFTLDMYGDKLITLAVGDQIASKVIDVATGRPLKSMVSNSRNGTLC